MQLETARLVLRPFTLSDAADALAWLGDPEVMRHIEPPFDLAQTEDFLRTCSHLVHCLCTKSDGRPIGHVIWHPYDGDAAQYELGWILARTHWGRGYAQEISEALLRYAGRQGIGQVVLEAVPENKASIRAIRSLGAVYSHTDGGLQVYILQI